MSIKKRLFRFAGLLIVIVLGVTVVVTLPLRWLNPPTTSFVLRDDARESLWLEHWVPADHISPHMYISVVAAEDQRFPDHYGLDMVELKKVLFADGGPGRGASTITQQLIKNLYLWPDRSLIRKGVEMWLALALELFVPKQRILELYLNVVEFGPEVYGVSEAAKVFFNKEPDDINRVEASLMAAVLPNPKRMSVKKPSPYVYERAQDIRFSIGRLGGIRYLDRLHSRTVTE